MMDRDDLRHFYKRMNDLSERVDILEKLVNHMLKETPNHAMYDEWLEELKAIKGGKDL